MTRISVSRYVNCPFSAAVELAEKVAGDRRQLYVTPAPPLGERVQFTATTTADASDETRKHDALLVAWRPQMRGVFPDLRGVLTVRPRHHGVSMRLIGHYVPPFGPLGRFFDFIAGRAIARRTLHRFLDELAAGIEAEYARERDHDKSPMTGVVRV